MLPAVIFYRSTGFNSRDDAEIKIFIAAGTAQHGLERKLWEDMAPTEKLAAIREFAGQLKALRDDRALRHEPDEAQPIQLRPSGRRARAFKRIR
jgi:hypothetical protein